VVDYAAASLRVAVLKGTRSNAYNFAGIQHRHRELQHKAASGSLPEIIRLSNQRPLTPMTALYICYQSIREPLTQTQVIAYLEGLSAATDGIVLLTFEREPISPESEAQIRTDLAPLRIEWRWLRYHKRPTLPATAFDTAVGIIYGFWLSRKRNVRLIHARSHVPGVMALVLAFLTGASFLFDVRGLLAEEYADSQVWRAGGFLFNLVKKAERHLMRAADAVVVLTERGRLLLEQWYAWELSSKPLAVIPCCVDLRRIPDQPPENRRSAITIGYVGKLGGWYATGEMMRFIRVADDVLSGVRFHMWTQSDPELAKLYVAKECTGMNTIVGRLAPEEVVPHLYRTCDAGLAFIKPSLSKWASSPTKAAEYLAAGLPVITNRGIGDLDEIICAEGVGVAVTEFTDNAYREAARQLAALLSDKTLRTRCVAAARRYFDLELIGWPRYRAIYEQLANA
jgi:glycosyltransferase involved in cell wall biosynthesis